MSNYKSFLSPRGSILLLFLSHLFSLFFISRDLPNTSTSTNTKGSFIFALAGPGGRPSPYSILGLQPSATNQEIKSSFRELSRKYHPDRNPSEDASDKFTEIRNAYDILMDENKRKIFDEEGYEGLDRFEKYGNEQPFDPGAFFGFPSARRRGPQKADTLAFPVYVALQDLYFGTTFNIRYKRSVVCPNINSCIKRDDQCSGPGKRTVTQTIGPGFFMKNTVQDDKCIGPGKAYKGSCKECPNGLKVSEVADISFKIDPGMQTGDKIVLEGKGEEAVGLENGDLIFVVQEVPDDVFERKGNNLYMTLELPLKDALVGFKREFKNLDLTMLKLDISDVTYDGKVLRYPKKGMPNKYGSQGDLFITIRVIYPEYLSKDQKNKIIEALT